MRILSLSTEKVFCGVADYNSELQEAVRARGHVYDVEPIDREAVDSAFERSVDHLFKNFVRRIPDYDAVVLQHEFGLYGNTLKQSYRTFANVCRAVAKANKPLAIFAHTNFPWRSKGWKSRLPIGRNSEWRSQKELAKLIGKTATVCFVHGFEARKSLVFAGVPDDVLVPIMHPIKAVSAPPPVRPLAADDTVNLAIFGFVSSYKGYETALRALQYLPERYVLTFAGGKHPSAPNDRTVNDIYSFLETGRWPDRNSLKAANLDSLRRRVRVTGYVPKGEIARIMHDTDIVLAPYTEHGPAGSGALGISIGHAKPIIASGTPGFRELNKVGDCLKLIAIDAPFELAEAIQRLAGDHNERLRLSQAAAAFAAAHTYGKAASDLLARLGAGSRQTSLQ